MIVSFFTQIEMPQLYLRKYQFSVSLRSIVFFAQLFSLLHSVLMKLHVLQLYMFQLSNKKSSFHMDLIRNYIIQHRQGLVSNEKGI